MFVNKCNLDSVLWFPIECPRAFGKFDDPNEFKRKWRDYFTELKALKETMGPQTATQARLKRQDDYESAYPEDLVEHKKAAKIMKELQRFSPSITPKEEGEPSYEDDRGYNLKPDYKDTMYGHRIEQFQLNPIHFDESRAGREQMWEAYKKGQVPE